MTHQTVNGPVTIERTVYWSKSVGTLRPTDRWLGIEQHSVSPGVREMCSLESLDSSFANVARSLKRTAQLTLSEDRIRRVVEGEGRRVIRSQRSNVLGASFTVADCCDGVMVTGTDGVFVPVVPETQKAKRRQSEAAKRAAAGRRSTRGPGRPKKGADGEYKEAKVLVFYNQSKSHKHVVATMGDCNALGTMMRREGRKVRLPQAAFSYSVADGAKWIERQYRQNLPTLDASILDWYHLKEHVVEASHAVYGEASAKAKTWQTKMLDAAWEQGSLVMLHRLSAYIRVHRGERREALESLRSYVEPRIAKTDYPSFREDGYDCGSGPTESQCGTLTARVKGAGMRWDAPNAESMMALAALDHSQLWATYWKLQRAA
ncbi:MAG: hypothetical protein GY788_09355 [bacterium]|nr:hypothetical protein [bacterium]